MTIRAPGRTYPRAPQPQSQEVPESPKATRLHGNDSNNVPQYVERVVSSIFSLFWTRSQRWRRGDLLAYGAFEEQGPVFEPALTTPDPITTREGLIVPDTNNWAAAIGAEFNNMRLINVFRQVSRPKDKIAIIPHEIF